MTDLLGRSPLLDRHALRRRSFHHRVSNGSSNRATSVTNRVTKTATSNGKGNFTLMFPDGDGDYILFYRALGYTPIDNRQVKRLADEDVLIADFRMTKLPVLLEAVRVAAGRQRPSREAGTLGPADVGGLGQQLDRGSCCGGCSKQHGADVVAKTREPGSHECGQAGGQGRLFGRQILHHPCQL